MEFNGLLHFGKKKHTYTCHLLKIYTFKLVYNGIPMAANIFPFNVYIKYVRGCIQKFPDWPPGARTANDIALCH